ncbi:MAG: Holliday junction branch migration protein RuvA [Planctomycetes bacterium]|nr:Holliday junction branch migration protein RuvA [Planctomycetota bacterium]
MISLIEGEVFSKTGGTVHVMVGPVGLCVNMPTSLADGISIGSRVRLLTRFHLTVDGRSGKSEVHLFGFLEEEQRELFDTLLLVSGVGPRSALDIISKVPVSEFIQAVLMENIVFLKKLKGVGEKTAKKICLEIQGKIAKVGSGKSAEKVSSSAHQDMLSALLALGYNPSKASAAIAEFFKANPSEKQNPVETVLPKILGAFSAK